MDSFNKKLSAYAVQHSTAPSEVLRDLERETHLKTLAPQMISGHLQGQLLTLLSRLQKPKAILEIGTFTGYSAICLAQGLQPEGVLHTIEANRELAYLIEKYLARAGLTDRIQLHFGQAEQIIPTLTPRWDLVFIDAGKQQYVEFYDLIIDQVRPGGLILADNVLWSGKVITPSEDSDAAALDQFNKKIQQDERVDNLLLPIRDGLLIIQKR